MIYYKKLWIIKLLVSEKFVDFIFGITLSMNKKYIYIKEN